MKGRSPWNRPSIKKQDAYKLLLQLGGKARWKDLEAHRSRLGWGPTTLKQTLDELVKDGSVMKEARLAKSGGPEVWYHAEEKGITLLLRNVLTLASIQPQQLEEWRAAAQKAALDAKIADKMSLEERIQAYKEADRDYYRLLSEAYWTLHNLVCKLAFPEIGNNRGYLGFTEQGDLQLIPAEILKRQGLDYPI
jgi:predicted ArsR family transcriptional regulator